MNNSKNKGFSLIELVVVVAILAILVGFLALNSGVITKQKVSKAREEIASSFQRGKVAAMSKDNVEAVIVYKKDGQFYVATVNNSSYDQVNNSYNIDDTYCVQKIKLDKKIQIKAEYEKGDGTGEQVVSLVNHGDNQIKRDNLASGAIFKFKKSTGEVEYVGASPNQMYCKKLRISIGGIEKNINVFSATGKIELE